MAIGSKYVYEIEAEEKVKWFYYEDDDDQSSSKLKSFLQDWINEMKKEIKKGL